MASLLDVIYFCTCYEDGQSADVLDDATGSEGNDGIDDPVRNRDEPDHPQTLRAADERLKKGQTASEWERIGKTPVP